MDPHPTPYPGKFRSLGNTRKDKGEHKVSKEPSRVVNIVSGNRHNRVFGTVRSTNIVVEKPSQEQTKAFKQSKPIAPSKKLPRKAGTRVELNKKESGVASREDVKDAARKPKSEPRKTSVRFQVQQSDEKGSDKGVAEDGPCTPMLSINPAVSLGTPFYSAKSCGMCRCDRLESASYWLNQIKLAESVGKHFVSAAFFHLALECNAEPIDSLKCEVKRYMARHSYLRTMSVWEDVSRDYGLPNEDPTVGVIVLEPVAASVEEKQDSLFIAQQGACGDGKSGCLGSAISGVPQSGSSEDFILDEDSASIEPNDNSERNPTILDEDSTYIEVDDNTEKNPSAVVIGEGTHENPNKPVLSRSSEEHSTIVNPIADVDEDSTFIEVNDSTEKNPSAVVIGEGAGEDLIKPAMSSSSEEHLTIVNPSADVDEDSTFIEVDDSTEKNPSAVVIGEGSHGVPNKPATSSSFEEHLTIVNPSAEIFIELNNYTEKNPSAVVIGEETHEDPNKPAMSSSSEENLTIVNQSADSTAVNLKDSSGVSPTRDDFSPVSSTENSEADLILVTLNGYTEENPSADSSPLNLDSDTREHPSVVLMDDGAKSDVRKTPVTFHEASLLVERNSGSNAANECTSKNSSKVATPGENLLHEESETRGSPFLKDSSPLQKKVQLRAKKPSGKSQAASGLCGERVDKNKDGPKRNQKYKEEAKKSQKCRVKSPRWM